MLQTQEIVKRPDGTVEIEGERAYPTYCVEFRWAEDARPNDRDPSPWQTDGMPEGRWRNVSGYRMMFREDKTPSELFTECMNRWRGYSTSMPLDPERRATCPHALDAGDVVIVVIFDRYETWGMGWFSHWTFDDGQTDEEALASFQRYVYRAEQEGQKRVGMLMGAEDRWRWCGMKTGDGVLMFGQPSKDERTDAPCRCPHCRRHGIIKICH